MNSQEFFQLCEGQWVSQRTLHHITTEETEVNKADLWIESIGAEATSVIDLCAEFNQDPKNILSSLEITWKGTLSNGKTQTGSTIMIAIADTDNATQGHLLSQPQTGKALRGRFSLGSDKVMTFTTEQEQGTTSERIWFASPNLRIRSNTLEHSSSSPEANFCSEIRRLGTPLPKPSEEDAQQTPLARWKARQQNSLIQNNS